MTNSFQVDVIYSDLNTTNGLWKVSPNTSHNVHWGINPPQKHYLLFFAKAPLKSANCLSPLFRQSPPIYCFFCDPRP